MIKEHKRTNFRIICLLQIIDNIWQILVWLGFPNRLLHAIRYLSFANKEIYWYIAKY